MSTNSKIYFSLPALLLVCSIAIGCGEVRAPVSGKVTYPDGSPLTVGEIRGYDGESSHIRAKIGEDGTFELYEVKPGDRVPAGKTYAIAIVNTEVMPDAATVARPDMSITSSGSSPVASIMHIHPKFGNDTTSGIILEVPNNSTPLEFNIEVTRP